MTDSDFDAKQMPALPKDGQRRHSLSLIWILIAIAISVIAALVIIIFNQNNSSPTIVKEDTRTPAYSATITTPAASENSQLSYGTWTGEMRYGQPHGQGTLKYTQQRLISQFDPKGTVARPGDYIIGEFDNGQLISGRLYRTDGSRIDVTTGLSPASPSEE